jgi:hypothetical protein
MEKPLGGTKREILFWPSLGFVAAALGLLGNGWTAARLDLITASFSGRAAFLDGGTTTRVLGAALHAFFATTQFGCSLAAGLILGAAGQFGLAAIRGLLVGTAGAREHHSQRKDQRSQKFGKHTNLLE